MKMLTKMAILVAVTAAPLLATQATYAQRYQEAPWGYRAAPDRSNDYRTFQRQRDVDEITRNDWSAGK